MTDNQQHASEPVGFYSIKDIIGNRKKGIPAIIPMSPSTWFKGVAEGRFHKGRKPFGPHSKKTLWLKSEIHELVKKMAEEGV